MVESIEQLHPQQQSAITPIELQYLISKRLGNQLSSNISDLIFSYMNIPQVPELQLTQLRLTTQTVIIELSNVRFNEFRIDVDDIEQQLKRLQDKGQIPSNLVHIQCKKFQIKLGKQNIECQKSFISKQNEMNSSIDFAFKSLIKVDKQYTLRLFRSGMIQIAGVTEVYHMSEVQFLVQQLIELYKNLFQCLNTVAVLYVNTVLCNYVSSIVIKPTQRIDLAKLVQDCNTTKRELFQSLCDKENMRCIYFDISQRRIVLYCKFIIDKQVLNYSKYNPKSTANKKIFRSITLLYTPRSRLIIQGCDGHYHKTHKVISGFQRIMSVLIPKYLFELQ